MNQIEMVARIGDQVLTVGKCSSAQARILVKRSHAAWLDGKLLLPLNPELLQVAVNHPDLLVDGNVSRAEVERRMEWLRTLIGAQAVSRAERGESRISEIVGRSPMAADLGFAATSEVEAPWTTGNEDLVEWYAADAEGNVGEVLPQVREPELEVLWPSEPDLGIVFGVESPDTRFEVLPPIDPSIIREELARVEAAVVESPAFNRARWPRVTLVGQREVYAPRSREEKLQALEGLFKAEGGDE